MATGHRTSRAKDNNPFQWMQKIIEEIGSTKKNARKRV
jgi:hypothetical protein